MCVKMRVVEMPASGQDDTVVVGPIKQVNTWGVTVTNGTAQYLVSKYFKH